MTIELHRPQPAAIAHAPASDRLALQPQNFGELLRFAETVAGTPFAPKHDARAVFAMVARGREIGLSAMQSLAAFHMIQGTPSLSADAMVAVILSSGLCETWRVVESTATRATITTRRRGEDDASVTWTIDDARTAGLLSNAMWTKYPRQMLRKRCQSDLARQVFPDVLMGLYTPDELDDGEGDHGGTATPPRFTHAPEVADPDAPQGSRAWGVFFDDIAGAPNLTAIHALYRDLLSGLHEESVEPTCYTDDSDGTPGAFTLASRRVAALGHHLARAEVHALLGVDGADLARWVDASAAVIDASGEPTVTAATWWLTHKGEMARHIAGAVYNTMARRLASGGADVAQVKAAKQRLTAEVTRQTPKPPPTSPTSPTGTDAPRASNDGAHGEAAATEATSASPAALASVARVAEKGGVTAYLSGKHSRRELEAAVRAHGRHVVGLVPAAIDRLDAITPADADGARVAVGTLRALVSTWADEGPVAQASRIATRAA